MEIILIVTIQLVEVFQRLPTLVKVLYDEIIS